MLYTKRKIKNIFRKYPNWTQTEINYLMRELMVRKHIASEQSKKEHSEKKLDEINNGILCLQHWEPDHPHKLTLLTELFRSYLQ